MNYNTLIKQLFAFIKQTGYINSNPSYNESANNTTIHLDDTEEVNAYADSKSANKHIIVIYHGLIEALKFIGIALAVYEHNRNLIQLRDACNFIGVNARSGFNQNKTDMGITELNYKQWLTDVVYERAKSFMSGSVLSVISHEMGHIALMHTQRNEIDYTISRNDERQADLFAQSVISSLPYQESNIMASLFSEILFTWMSKEYGGPATTHPHSRERVYNTYNSHEQYFASMNLPIESLEYFVPKKVVE